MQAELADHEEAGGDVHMQPLMPVAQSLDGICYGLWFAASSTGKTVASDMACSCILLLEMCFVLFPLGADYLHIRSFESGKVSTHALDAGHPVQVKVQHGDVIAISAGEECPSFLKATVAAQGCHEGAALSVSRHFAMQQRKMSLL